MLFIIIIIIIIIVVVVVAYVISDMFQTILGHHPGETNTRGNLYKT